VHPSLAEGGCAGIQEALACGVPCVVSSHSTSAVRSGCEGIVVPPGDVPALKAALARLCEDEQLRKQMSIAARKRAEEALSLDSVCATSAEIYRTIVESYSPAS
jgi:glycosyltransferase involved in cell wall biosynthesis